MSALRCLSSDQLLARLLDLVHRGRELEADLIAHLAEVDARRLYLREGCTSMFAYCVGYCASRRRSPTSGSRRHARRGGIPRF
jgi:hypothetical protein